MGYGLDSEDTRTNAGGERGDFIRKFFLRDGDTAYVRFLTDGDGIYKDYFHSVREPGFDGKIRWFRRYCTESSEAACSHCESGSRPTVQIFVWLWVYKILHATQPQGKDYPLEVVKGRRVYLEEVNAVRLWQRGIGKDATFLNLLKSLYREFETLIDRDYIVQCMAGGKLDDGGVVLTHQLIPDGKYDVEEAISSLASQLPLLGDAAQDKVNTLDGRLIGKGDTTSDKFEPQQPDPEEVKAKSKHISLANAKEGVASLPPVHDELHEEQEEVVLPSKAEMMAKLGKTDPELDGLFDF